jgi:uncharacterized protein YutE (UPF0331/DUF86 family)
MVDRERALAYLAELRASLGDWERYQRAVGRGRLERDRDTRNMVLHAMLTAIQSAIDIGEQIIAERRFERPGSYRETFEILGARGLLEPDLAARLANLAAFRNVLVHVYWKLDLERVEAHLREGREPLDRFCAVVKALLEE